jgi:hypothetical protein
VNVYYGGVFMRDVAIFAFKFTHFVNRIQSMTK